MSRVLTPAALAQDLATRQDDGGFAYWLNPDGETFTVERYGNTGEVEKTYLMEIKITEKK